MALDMKNKMTIFFPGNIILNAKALERFRGLISGFIALRKGLSESKVAL